MISSNWIVPPMLQKLPVFRHPLAALVVAASAALCFCPAPSSLALPVEGVVPANNREYAPAVRRLIQNAKKRLYFQLYQTRFYAEYPDTPSNRFLEDIIAAARRGVEVKMILDTGEWNPGQKNEHNLDFARRLEGAGVQIWEDSPTDVSHQKVILADDDLVLLGSVNWTYYSLAINNETAALVRSAPLNVWFRRYFYERAAAGRPLANARPIRPEEIDTLAPPVTEAESTESASRAATAGRASSGGNGTGRRGRGGSTSPRRGELPAADVKPIPDRLYYPAVHEALLRAKKSVDVVQRNFKLSPVPPMGDGGALPGEPAGAVDVLAHDLVAAARRGVRVRVVLDHTETMEDADNARTAAWLRARGVEVFQEDPRIQTHAKMLVIDDDKVVLGSTNWTRPAVEQGNEASVLITSPQVAAIYKRFVNDLIRKGGPYRAQVPSIWKNASEGP